MDFDVKKSEFFKSGFLDNKKGSSFRVAFIHYYRCHCW